jgi:membrane protease YdiL (CAAX protease family)
MTLQVSSTPTTAVPPPPRPASGRATRPRSQQFALFLAAIAWYFCAIAIAASASLGLAIRFELVDAQPLIEAACLLFLVIVGFAFLRFIERRRMPLRMTLGLPRRATSRAEWATGAALGWGLAVASVLPMALARTLNVRLWKTPHAFELLALSLVTLALATLARAVGVHGYAFQRLIEALGPVRATIAMALFAAIYTSMAPGISSAAIAISVLASVLLSLCWLRTHGLWLMWGLHFAWAASTAVLFGLPLAGDTSFSSVVDTRAVGPLWLTGGSYGPAAALLSFIFALAAIPILIRVTSDYAWDYTHPPLIPAGYDVTIPPPAAHVAMEQAALEAQPVNPASLVQILPATPRTPTIGVPPE